jgi:hypothetical protein
MLGSLDNRKTYRMPVEIGRNPAQVRGELVHDLAGVRLVIADAGSVQRGDQEGHAHHARDPVIDESRDQVAAGHGGRQSFRDAVRQIQVCLVDGFESRQDRGLEHAHRSCILIDRRYH